MFDPNTLLGGAESYRRREAIGHRCMVLAFDGPWSAFDRLDQIARPYPPVHEDDIEAAASDAISDILTALYGPAGTWSDHFHARQNAREAARNLLDRAYRSYDGDAEDYTTAK